MKSKENIYNLIEKLIQEGEDLCNKPFEDKQYEDIGLITKFVNLEGFKKWIGRFNLLLSLLGHLGKPWKDIYAENKKGNRLENALSILGSIKSIKESMDDGLLARFEDFTGKDA